MARPAGTGLASSKPPPHLNCKPSEKCIARKYVPRRPVRRPSPEIINIVDTSDEDEPEAANLEFTYGSEQDGLESVGDGLKEETEQEAEEVKAEVNGEGLEPFYGIANGVEDDLESVDEKPEAEADLESVKVNGVKEAEVEAEENKVNERDELDELDEPSPKLVVDALSECAPSVSPALASATSSAPNNDVESEYDDVVVKRVLGPGEDLEPATLEPLCLPPVETQVDNHWVYLFFRFCAERHAMYDRREAGVARDKLTTDETMTATHIGNVYRQLDPSSSMMANDIIGAGDQSVEEVCFRVFLFCMFYKVPTWEALCGAATGGLPTWEHYEADLPAMEAALHQMSIVEKKHIYYGGFQLVPPNVYFANDRNRNKDIVHYASSLRLVLAMMKAGLPARLKECQYAVDASYVLGAVPTLGGFLGLNILCFLNDSTNFKWLYRDFATCGPGSRKFMQRMFGKSTINSVAMEDAGLRWLTGNQWRYWARLGLDPPHAWQSGLRPGMRVLDVENALCWAHRYVNAYQDRGTRSLADIPAPSYDPEITEKCGPPAWCVEEKWLGSTSRMAWDADHREEDDRVESLGDNVYEIEKVVARLGSLDDKDGRFRVRWTGWTPEHDTWERASSLREDAEEALEHWLDLERRVQRSIAEVKRTKPFVWPDRKPVTFAEGRRSKRSRADVDYAPQPEPDVVAQRESRSARAAKRARREARAKEE